MAVGRQGAVETSVVVETAAVPKEWKVGQASNSSARSSRDDTAGQLICSIGERALQPASDGTVWLDRPDSVCVPFAPCLFEARDAASTIGKVGAKPEAVSRSCYCTNRAS